MKPLRKVVIIHKKDIRKRKTFNSVTECVTWFIFHRNLDENKRENTRRFISKVLSDKYPTIKTYSGFYIIYKEQEKDFIKKRIKEVYYEELNKLGKYDMLDLTFIIKILRKVFPHKRQLYNKIPTIKKIIKHYHFYILNDLIDNKIIKIIRLPLNFMHIYVGKMLKGKSRNKVLLSKFPKRMIDNPFRRSMRLYLKSYYIKKMNKKCL